MSVLALAISAGAVAADETKATKNKNDALGLERIVVTGAAIKGRTVMASSVSVSSLSTDELEIATPRTTAEIFRTLPGIRSESSGGEGNANIAVRGLPVASGGAKFLQLQEDGLPIMQFGDVAFGNADIFLRADSTVQTIEAIRGGTASTATSNAPGGIINFISKTGESDSGSVSTTIGLDYDSYRTDFEYGGEINDSMRFHVGGFLRNGEGVRDAGYTANTGGQIKANLTKEFDDGYVRLYFKHLDDKSIGYLPMPVRGDGGSVAGFDSQTDTPHSAYFLKTTSQGANGETRNGDMRDGMNPQVDSFGFEAVFDLGNDWSVENRLRKSAVSGSFISPFTSNVGDEASIAGLASGETDSHLVYANGPSAGQEFTGDVAMGIVAFDVEMTDFGSTVNDFKLIKEFDTMTVSFGYYKAVQNIEMNWLWSSYISEVKGDNAALLNVVGSDGTEYSDNGLYGYGVPIWGNCCTRGYDAQYDIAAPYVSFSADFEDITFDASIRRDSGSATGTYSGNVVSQIDVNKDGVISKAEENVATIDSANAQAINYDWSYTSYSIGANYTINNDVAVFSRLSKGGRANADRLLFGKVNADGSVSKEDAVDEVEQFEVGVKYRGDGLSVFATAFYAETQEQNFEATTQKFFDRTYEAKGIELETAYFIGDFDIRATATWTDAEIAKDNLAPELVGNTPRRQAELIYSMVGRYNFDSGSAGVSFIGTTGAYAQDSNDLKFSGYTQVNAFASYRLSESLTVAINANNLFDAEGITEAEEGSAAASDIIRARTINGRSTSLTLKYEF